MNARLVTENTGHTDACWDLIRTASVGRVVLASHARPLILPVNHTIDDGAILFRTTRGTKLHEARRERAEVAFEVDQYDETSGTGWAAVAFGRMRPVLDAVRLAHLDGLDLRPWPPESVRADWVEIEPSRFEAHVLHGAEEER